MRRYTAGSLPPSIFQGTDMLYYPVPLPNRESIGGLILPRGLTEDEADRVCAMVRALVGAPPESK